MLLETTLKNKNKSKFKKNCNTRPTFLLTTFLEFLSFSIKLIFSTSTIIDGYPKAVTSIQPSMFIQFIINSINLETINLTHCFVDELLNVINSTVYHIQIYQFMDLLLQRG
jgi:hypothetical protein